MIEREANDGATPRSSQRFLPQNVTYELGLDITPRPGETVIVASGFRLHNEDDADSQDQALTSFIDHLRSSSQEGYLVLAGDLFDGLSTKAFDLDSTLRRYDTLFSTLRHLDGVQTLVLPGSRDHAIIGHESNRSKLAENYGIVCVSTLRIAFRNEADTRFVEIETSLASPQSPSPQVEPLRSYGPIVESVLSRLEKTSTALDGADRLERPQEFSTFIVSRLLYRRAIRYLPLGLVPIFLSFLIKIPFVLNFPAVSTFRSSRILTGGRLLALSLTTVVDVIVVTAITLLFARRLIVALERTAGEFFEDPARIAVDSTGRHILGRILGGPSSPSLSGLGEVFVGSPGTIGRRTRRVAVRFGLPDIFIEVEVATWIEIDIGATPHVRLISKFCQPPSRWWSALLLKGRIPPVVGAETLASFPRGHDYPVPAVLELRRTLFVRRLGFIVLVLFALTELLTTLTPPLRGGQRFIRELLPFSLPPYANALGAVGAVVLLALAAGIRRGQRRAWYVALVAVALGGVLNLTRGGEVLVSIVYLVIFLYLGANRQAFSVTAANQSGITRAFRFIGAGVIAVIVAVIALEGFLIVYHHRALRLSEASISVIGRLVGITTRAVPTDLGRVFDPALFLTGLTVIGGVAVSLINPYLTTLRRTLRSSTTQRSTPRQIIASYSRGTLDYFALRDDKEIYQDSNTIVAYAEYGSTVVVSPDPVGPIGSAERVFSSFLTKTKAEGKSLVVLGADESWLPTYRQLGLRPYYIGDEAIVDVHGLSLEGKTHKSLRQAVNRMKKYGYRVEFSDPLELNEVDRQGVLEVLEGSRRGGVERGFSMTLGRVFDPRDQHLLMSICRAPNEKIVGFCQWVPAPGIGGFSLDIMRRDIGDHPNGLIDLLIVDTIGYLKEQNFRSLSLNFAAMRATLAGERGDGLSQRVERWVLQRLSDSMQIESLWRFNAKFDPSWTARYLVYDNPEDLPRVVLAVARAESLWDIPIVGRFFGSGGKSETRADKSTPEPLDTPQL